jgi:hypothetical protein
MSTTYPVVTVFYPLAPWLAWLPKRLWKPKYKVKLVRVDPNQSHFFDPEGTMIEEVETPYASMYCQVR